MSTTTQELFAAKDAQCPLCGLSFRQRTVPPAVAKPERQDTDFCPYYDGPNPLFYAIWICPSCGYAALEEHYRSVPGPEREALRGALGGRQDHRRFDFHQGERNLFTAMSSFRLAMACYEARGAAPELRAAIQLRLGWLCRLGNDRKREGLYLEAALPLYREAYEKAQEAEAKVGDTRIAYLIGEIYRRTGNSREAINWYLRSRYDRPGKGPEWDEIYDLARARIGEAKESIRFFEYLKDVEVLKALAIEEVAALAAQIRNQSLPVERLICRQGETGDSMFILMNGQVRVLIDGQQVATLKAGDVLGEMSLLTGLPRTATIMTDSAVELIEIDRTSFRNVMQTNPAIASNIARIVSERQRRNAHAAPEEPGAMLDRVKAFMELA